MSASLKERAWLLLAAAAVATSAWVFWHHQGEHASSALGVVMLLVFAIDNYRLRRRVRALELAK